MPRIKILKKDGSAYELEAPENWSIMQAAVENNIREIAGSCGGSMACATCHVIIHPDWVEKVTTQDNEISEEEEDMLDMAFDVKETSRLGCQVKITPALDGLIVALPGVKTKWETP